MSKMQHHLAILQSDPESTSWLELAKLTMCRLILFNKRRRAEVKDLTVEAFMKRPNWKDDTSKEIMMSLSETDKLLSQRMDMVISAGKSLKNNDAYVLLPPDAKKAIEVLINTRKAVGIPPTNPYIFARRKANSPLTGNTELREIAHSCPGVKCPDRIKSTFLRKYIATVTQVIILLTYLLTD